jgi:hypothetical protein
VTEPPILDDPPTLTGYLDTGQRQILRARYVTDSFQVTDQTAWMQCYGAAVTFSFDLTGDAVFTEPVVICDLGYDSVTKLDEEVFDDCYCRPLTVDIETLPDDCGRCGWPCTCQITSETSTEDTHPATFTPTDFGACQWSRPLCTTRRTCITPPLPFTEVVPIISIEAGPSTVELEVTMWSAHPGLPDPQTCLGDEIYAGRDPLVEPIQVRVPAGTTLILDGRIGSADLLCDTRAPAGNLVTTAAGTRFQLPSLRCARRMWIAFDADCYNLPEEGHRITVELAGRYDA